MLLDVPCSNSKSFNVFIVFAKIIFSFLIYWFRKIKLLILCFEYKKYANFYEAWESAFNRQPMADEFNRVDFLPIGFRPAYKNNL